MSCLPAIRWRGDECQGSGEPVCRGQRLEPWQPHCTRLRQPSQETDPMNKKLPLEVRILSPEEYPESITTPAFPGAHKARVTFAAQHPLGLYHVEEEGAGSLGVYFTPRRAKKPKRVASAANMVGAFRLISDHKDELMHPEAQRE